MNFLKKLFADKKAVRSAISGLLLLVSITVMIVAVLPKTKAWFAKNNQTTANGITLTAKNQYMRFDDAFTSKAIMNGVTVAEGNYKRHTDGKYYQVGKDGQFVEVDGKKSPLFYDSLYPGEDIELTFRITCSEDQIGENFKIYLRGLDTSDTFLTRPTDSTPSQKYSVLGVYKAYSAVGNNAEKEIGYIVDYAKGDKEAPQTFDLASGTWNKAEMDENGFITVKIRFRIDLTNYNKLSGTYSNLLSEKSAHINDFVVAPAD